MFQSWTVFTSRLLFSSSWFFSILLFFLLFFLVLEFLCLSLSLSYDLSLKHDYCNHLFNFSVKTETGNGLWIHFQRHDYRMYAPSLFIRRQSFFFFLILSLSKVTSSLLHQNRVFLYLPHFNKWWKNQGETDRESFLMPPTLDSLTLLFTPSEMDEERKREKHCRDITYWNLWGRGLWLREVHLKCDGKKTRPTRSRVSKTRVRMAIKSLSHKKERQRRRENLKR